VAPYATKFPRSIDDTTPYLNIALATLDDAIDEKVTVEIW
jgi:hypothetical protein